MPLQPVFLAISLAFCFHFLYCLELPCKPKQPGESCIDDEACQGPNTVCSKQVCTCPPMLEDYSLSNYSRICRAAPTTIAAKCQKSCKPPLVCQNGKCVCWKAQQSGNKCSLSCPAKQMLIGQNCQPVSLTVGGSCGSDQECMAPFTQCKNRICDCVPGSKKINGACTITCPDGSVPGKACRLKFSIDQQILAISDQMDTCPRGQRCVTYGKPLIGHCCKLYCPYGQPDLNKSCRVGDRSGSTACPTSSTHYCQKFSTYGVTDSVCCPRPCRDPTPFYWNGQCLPLARPGDPCSSNEECEGGAKSQCVADGQGAKRCKCRDGYSQSDPSNGLPTCAKSCTPLLSVQVQGQCLKPALYKQKCVDTAQCPSNMRCVDGYCDCSCGRSQVFGACYNPDDPLGIDPLMCRMQAIFQPDKINPKCQSLQ